MEDCLVYDSRLLRGLHTEDSHRGNDRILDHRLHIGWPYWPRRRLKYPHRDNYHRSGDGNERVHQAKAVC